MPSEMVWRSSAGLLVSRSDSRGGGTWLRRGPTGHETRPSGQGSCHGGVRLRGHVVLGGHTVGSYTLTRNTDSDAGPQLPANGVVTRAAGGQLDWAALGPVQRDEQTGLGSRLTHTMVVAHWGTDAQARGADEHGTRLRIEEELGNGNYTECSGTQCHMTRGHVRFS